MIKIFILFCISIITISCQSAKDALTLKKKNNTDEFLVEKKNPLSMPPEFGKLPTPENIQNNAEIIDENNIIISDDNIEKIFNSDEKNSSLDKNTSSVEKKILENIR